MADGPDNGRKEKRQQQTKQWAGDRYDDLVQRGNSWQPRPVHICLPLDDVHRRKLRQSHEAPERQRAERVLDSVDCSFPDRFAEPDTEFFYVKPSPAGGQKMAQFMHDDEQIEEDENFEQDENDASNVE